jgi:hypothetical protein
MPGCETGASETHRSERKRMFILLLEMKGGMRI